MKNESIVRHLQKTGLSEKTAIVYSTLLEMGGAYPSRIAEITKLNRSTIYKILLELSVKGLVTEIEREKKLFYQIENPEKLIRFAKTQSDMAHEAYEKTQELIPELEGIFAQNPNKPIIRYFNNAEGITSIYEEMVSQKKKYEMLAFSHGQAFKGYLPAKSMYKFIKSKERIGITTRAIIPDTLENRKYNEDVFTGINKKIWPDIRYVPKEIFPFEAEMTLYDDNKLAITKLTGEKLIGLVIEDKLIHDMFKMIFELLWKSDRVEK